MTPLQDPIQLPRDAKLTSLLLSSLGQSNYSPLVLHQLLELSHRHMTLHLQDALLYAEHADRREISVEDLKLARKIGGGVPSKDVFSLCKLMIQSLMEIADKKNAMPLPQVPEKFGLRLPVERHTLTAPTVSLNPVQKTRHSHAAPAASKPAVKVSPASMVVPPPVVPTARRTTASRRVSVVESDEDYDMDE